MFNITVKAFILSTVRIASPPKPCAAVRTTDASHQDDMTLVTTMRMNESQHEIKSHPVYFFNTCCWCCYNFLFLIRDYTARMQPVLQNYSLFSTTKHPLFIIQTMYDG